MNNSPLGEISALPRLIRIADLLPQLLSETEILAECRRTKQPAGPITGFKWLDEYLGGYFVPGLHILTAAPGTGKTAIALQIASDCGCPALYVSAEMRGLALFRRLIARQTKTPAEKLRSGQLDGRTVEKLALQTIEKLPHLAILDATVGIATPGIIQDAAEAIRGTSRNVLVILDSMHLWARSVAPVASSEYDLLNEAITSAIQIAQSLNAPVLGISHRNRIANRTKNGGMHTSSGTGRFEYLAETVIDLEPEDGGDSIAAKVEKNRDGIAGKSALLCFDGPIQNFTECGFKD